MRFAQAAGGTAFPYHDDKTKKIRKKLVHWQISSNFAAALYLRTAQKEYLSLI